jgi:excisionase family DNA binding protein
MHAKRRPLARAEATEDPPPSGSALLPRTSSPRFLSVGAVAKVLDMSEATMYRAIRAGEFPAVKVRNRYVVPAKVLDAMEDAALTTGAMVDAAEWVDRPGVA